MIYLRSIGEIIRKERLEKGIKQVYLAKGICSTSYLSKIENNSIDGSDDIIALLIKKIGVEIKRLPLKEEEEVLMKLKAEYKIGILERNKEYVVEKLEEFENQKIDFNNIENYYLYQLYIFRMKLVSNNNADLDLSNFDQILNYKNHLSNRALFLFYLNAGLFNYLINKPHISMPYFNEAAKFIGDAVMEEWEIADFHNILSAFYLSNDDNLISTKHSYKALEYYKTHLIFDRMIESYMKLGIAYKNMLDYNKGEEFFHLSLDLSKRFHVDIYRGAIYHNLGNLYFSNNQINEGLKYHFLSYDLKCKTSDIPGSLITILSLINEYSKMSNLKAVLEWCEIGLKNNELNKKSPLYLSYFYHFKIYQLLQTSGDELIELLIEAIPYFEEIQDYRHIQKYSILLANKLVERKKLKQATEYYRKSTKILYKQKKIGLWEDL